MIKVVVVLATAVALVVAVLAAVVRAAIGVSPLGGFRIGIWI